MHKTTIGPTFYFLEPWKGAEPASGQWRNRIVSGDPDPCTVTGITSPECFPLKPASFLCHMPRKMPDLDWQPNHRLVGPPTANSRQYPWDIKA
jgi:hypothetical protein